MNLLIFLSTKGVAVWVCVYNRDNRDIVYTFWYLR